MGDERPEQPDRRSILKKAGVVGVGMWAAPVVSSITSPAFAQGSDQPGGGDPPDDNSVCPITVDVAGLSITISVTAGACNTLQFGTDQLGLVCDDCVDDPPTERTQVFTGTFPVGYALNPYMLDRGSLNGSCCTSGDCNTRYDCSTPAHFRTVKDGPNSYSVYVSDAGCGCTGNTAVPSPGNPATYNLKATIVIA
jgi:hypothetical protein